MVNFVTRKICGSNRSYSYKQPYIMTILITVNMIQKRGYRIIRYNPPLKIIHKRLYVLKHPNKYYSKLIQSKK